MKSNKSFKKRIKVTRRGKLVSRAKGQNHFNAKESAKGHMRRKRASSITMNRTDSSRFLA